MTEYEFGHELVRSEMSWATLPTITCTQRFQASGEPFLKLLKPRLLSSVRNA